MKSRAGNGQAPPLANGAAETPRARPAPMRPRGSLIAAIDIGTTKVCCFIARVEDEPRILGIGTQIARGVRAGTVIDLDAASNSIVSAVHAAEEMANAPTTDGDQIGVAATSGFANDLVYFSARKNHRSLRAREELKMLDFLENLVPLTMGNTSFVPF